MTSKPRVPAGLVAGGGGATLWHGVVAGFELRPDELRILEDACREADLVDVLVAGLDGAELTARGSQGQPVVNPLIPELRQHRATLSSLIRQLRLTDDESPSSGSNSTAARSLALARWNRGPK